MSEMQNVGTMDELFSLWHEAHRTEPDTSYLRKNIPQDVFLPDGIIDAAQFRNAAKKILFIAKEANWYQADAEADPDEPVVTAFWHRDVAFARTPKTSFSNRLSMLANAITNADIQGYSVVDKNHDVLQSVAIINLNKRGGYSYCVWDTLNTYVKTYQDYIRKQISMIAPDLIVCCGYDVKWLLREYNLASACSQTIWVYHPSYFAISDADYLEQLKCAMTGEQWHPSRATKVIAPIAQKRKGIIFDTNKTYSDVSTMDMLLGNKVSAYDDAARLIDSFNREDYVFFSVKGLGIAAGGRVISETEEIHYSDALEKYKVVEFIAPTPDQIPHGEENLRALSWNQVSELLDHKRFWHARTDKRPYLTEGESLVLLGALQGLYAQEASE